MVWYCLPKLYYIPKGKTTICALCGPSYLLYISFIKKKITYRSPIVENLFSLVMFGARKLWFCSLWPTGCKQCFVLKCFMQYSSFTHMLPAKKLLWTYLKIYFKESQLLIHSELPMFPEVQDKTSLDGKSPVTEFLTPVRDITLPFRNLACREKCQGKSHQKYRLKFSQNCEENKVQDLIQPGVSMQRTTAWHKSITAHHSVNVSCLEDSVQQQGPESS